ncbi:paired-like homeodomain transcription factor LEUTX [Phodopus roborovskii]|uniref:paired-like homeodomain transcription factor LEUTX n=1 Tax=Phodopus roborovskii TaxID=109678 RepID=UPI0021E4814B|nr:paired-like homeodomain transcription factor LEUTX [Phodopus roborovskii]
MVVRATIVDAGQSQHDHQYCTVFSLEQIKVLQEAFDSNMFPSKEESQELASRLQLKELVVKMWFRNQRDKLQTQQQNHQWRSPLATSSQAKVKSLKDDEVGEVLVLKADYAQLPSTRGSDNSDLESWENFRAKQPEDAASTAKCVEHSELLGIYQSSPRMVQPPWVSLAFDIDTLVKMYDLPGDDDPQDFDKYLYPGCLD